MHQHRNANRGLTINQNFIFRPKAYRNFTLGLFSFLCAYIIAAAFTPVQSSDASEITITNSATGNYVTITSADTVGLTIDSSPTGSLAFAGDTVNVKTNVSTGYKLYVSATSENMYSTDDTDHSKVHFVPTSGTIDSPAELDLNSWGFSLSAQNVSQPTNSATWVAVPENNYTLIHEENTQTSTAGIDTPIYYGANATTRLPSGDYTTTVIYTAVAEDTSAPLMQDFTNATCEAMGTNTTQVLMDSRNSKTYNIVKAADGNCWMADNLEIDNITIYPEDSNINSGSFHIPASSEWNTNDYSQALVHIVTENSTSTISGDAKTPYLGEHYYNWYAATAGASPTTPTSNVTTSICPKGWRLPENSTASGAKSWSNLMSAYSATVSTGADLTTTDESAPQYNLGFHKYYGLWYWNYPSESGQGTFGHFWTSTSSTDANAYYLRYSSDEIVPQVSNGKGYGMSIRCVFGDSRTLQDITYMQDINTNICQNTAETTSYADAKTLIDNRGKGNAGSATGTYKVIKAKDGNCWMTDNLNIYNYTISAETSDFTSPANYTIPAGITDPTEWNTNNYQTKKVEISHGLGQYASQDQQYWNESYYNWTVAVAKETTAGVTTAPDTSICPKGWTLPTNGDSGVNKSWARLFSNIPNVGYNYTAGSQFVNNTNILGFTKYYGLWDWNDASENVQGSDGYFWSGTPSAETNAYSLFYNSGGVNPQANYNKGHGFSIRCVSR
ncbi:hypothetical protein IKG16_02210 [Candidatus Saccharibacteria bacterium]|nr:hypothetical protein [Candidatus Saccharibacteria bacterium]